MEEPEQLAAATAIEARDRDERLIMDVVAGRADWVHPREIVLALCRRYLAQRDDGR